MVNLGRETAPGHKNIDAAICLNCMLTSPGCDWTKFENDGYITYITQILEVS